MYVYVVTTTSGAVVGVYTDHEAALSVALDPTAPCRILQRVQVETTWTREQVAQWADPARLRRREVA